MVILCWFQLFVWLKYWGISKALPQHLAADLSPISHLTNWRKNLSLLIKKKKTVTAKKAWNYAWYWSVAAINSFKDKSPKNAARTRWIFKRFRTLSRLVLATESASVLFRLSYFDLLPYCTSFFPWFALYRLLLSLRMIFFFRITEKEND